MASWTTCRFINLNKIATRSILRAQIRKFSADDSKGCSKGLVVGVYEKEGESEEAKFTSGAEKFDDRVAGKLMELVRECNITGVLGKGKVFSNFDGEFSSVAVVGLGKEGIGYNELENLDEGMENARVAAAVGAIKLQQCGMKCIAIDGMEYPEQAAEGGALAVWLFQDNKRKQDRRVVPKLELYDSPDQDSWTRGLFKAEAQNLARRLSDSPANMMTPTCFAQAAVDALCPCGVNVEVRNIDWIEAQNLTSFLTVARSSCEPPVLLEITYCGASPDERPILLLGKGITYNSGGLCLHRKKGIDELRACMAGAAVVVASIRAAAALSLPINVTGIIPLCENMPSGMAFKPGDVITCLNGKTLCIHDTSKTSVVVMADPLIYAQNTYKPKLVLDIATTSIGVKKALGGSATGVFSSSHYIWKQLHKAGALSGDRMWRLPLWNYYSKKVTDYLSFDVSNRGHGPASACLAAAAIKEFIPCNDWAHLDIRGVGMRTTTNTIPYLARGRMTGRPTRTIIQFLYQMACPEEQAKDLRDT